MAMYWKIIIYSAMQSGFDFQKLVASAQDHHTVVRRVTSKDAGNRYLAS